MSTDLNTINGAITAQSAGWTAGPTSVSALTSDEMKRKLGWYPGADPALVAARERLATTNAQIQMQSYALQMTPGTIPAAVGSGFALPAVLPACYDLRNASGVNYVTPVKDQGLCGSCVAFGTIAAVESQVQIDNGNPNRVCDLSEADLFFCIGPATGATCAGGWDVPDALDGCKYTGVHDEPCFPYNASSHVCSIHCATASCPTRISDWRPHTRIKDMKAWLAGHGPLITCLSIYEDFRFYKSGIYRHVSGAYEGGHCVCCVGYCEDGGDKYWICKNSWGDAGFFKIAYGECGIDAVMWGVEL
jgi:C1A family cysteine protease